jgi:hypothetical protein
MKWKVDLYVGGKVFPEYVYATNRKDAIETATARNPKARVVGTNPIVGE